MTICDTLDGVRCSEPGTAVWMPAKNAYFRPVASCPRLDHVVKQRDPGARYVAGMSWLLSSDPYFEPHAR